MKRGIVGCKRLNKFNNLIVFCDGLCMYWGGGLLFYVVYDSYDSIVVIFKVLGKLMVFYWMWVCLIIEKMFYGIIFSIFLFFF